MTILVTGGAGFIGSHVVDRYIADGKTVAVIDNLSTGFKKNLNKKAKFFKLDIRSKRAAQVIKDEKPEIINHHAAQIDLRKSVEDPIQDAKINILGLLNLMEAAVKAGSLRKVIFASTGGAIYGDAQVIPTPEDYPAWPVSPYGVAKLACEYYLHYYANVHGIPFVSLRYANVFGPRQNPEGEAGVVAILAQHLVRGSQPTIHGDGQQTRDFVYITDVVEANVAALEEGRAGIYNIGTGRETEINTIFSKLASLLAIRIRVSHGPAKEGEQRRSALDCSKARRDLGWQPKVALDSGLEKTAEYFKRT